MTGGGDAILETDRAKRKREARDAFEQKTASDALDFDLRSILAIPEPERTEDMATLLRKQADVVDVIVSNSEKRNSRKATTTSRTEERLDDDETVAQQIEELADMIRQSKPHGGFVLHTGAGFSTATGIPDFRGKHGVWTMKAKGKQVPMPRFENCAPTKAHMAVRALWENNSLSHVVTQNVDGLHQRAGLPDSCVSELHGSVYRERCDEKDCDIHKNGFIKRPFDVTNKKPQGGRHRHKTGRVCVSCGNDLKDFVVQFGEKLDDDVLACAREVSKTSQLSIVMGTSLKIPPANTLPRLSKQMVIVNLQWTKHDSRAVMKMHAKCDDVMLGLCEHLGLEVPVYDPATDEIGEKVVKGGGTFVGRVGGSEGKDAGRPMKEESETDAKPYFPPLSKQQRRMKNPSVPKPT